MKTRSDQATQSAFPLFFVFLFLSTAYMPKSQLPDWLATVVDYNPMDYLIRGVRNLMLESWAEAAGPLLVAFACAAAIALLLSLVNMRAYRTIVE
jgi:ABC-2 type transport system permease protein